MGVNNCIGHFLVHSLINGELSLLLALSLSLYRLNQVFWLFHSIGRPATLKCATLEGSSLKNESILVNIGRPSSPSKFSLNFAKCMYGTSSVLLKGNVLMLVI